MNSKFTNQFLMIGLLGLFTIGVSYFIDMYSAFYGDKDIYWTHEKMKLPIEKTENDFQLYISDKPLQKYLYEKTLYVIDESGTKYSVAAKDISVRLNNWNKIKSTILTKTTFTGFAFGITLAFLIMGLVQVYNQKRKSN